MMKRICVSVLSALVVLAFAAKPASALPPFKKAFQEKYADGNSAAFKAAFKKQSCNTCHVKGKGKDVRNAYGEELAKLIEGDAKDRIKEAGEAGGDAAKKAETEKVMKELEAAFKKVESMKAAGGSTYGERIKEGKLPVE